MIFPALILPLLLLFTPPASASELLIFRDEIMGVREEQLISELSAQKHLDASLPLKLAPIDLNGDGVDEWFIRQNTTSSCEADSSCKFTLAVLKDKKPVALQFFQARKIGISSEKEYGISKLLVYNKKSDDFAFSVYVWNPFEGTFKPQ